MTLGENLKLLRAERGLTLSALASASGLTKGFISQVETGRSTPSLASLSKLATALGTLPAHLMADAPKASGAGEKIGLRRAHRVDRSLPVIPRIALVDSDGGAHYYACTLTAGSRLVLQGGQGGSAKGLAMVRSGAVRIVQAATDLSLAEGEVGTWDPAARACVIEIGYGIEVGYARRAELFISLPSSALPPRLETVAALERRPTVRSHVEGPFRIIAMRAERRLAGRP